MDEFELIRRFFSAQPVQREDVLLGIGDDAALLHVPAAQELVVSTDTLVAGMHFPVDLSAEAVGHRALAVNLSDLAAMGAAPAWALLALTLPEVDEKWLEGFAWGFFQLARRFNVALVGGNLARGALNITLSVHGFVPTGEALTRSGAHAGDHVFVTGCLGDAAAGLERLRAGVDAADADSGVRRFCFPEPRITAGLALRGIASAAIDVSDGFAADLGHILQASGVGARIAVASLPLSPALLRHVPREEAERLALSGGDDYELCFTVPPERMQRFESRKGMLDCPVTRLGEIIPEKTLRCMRTDTTEWPLNAAGYKHF